MKIKLDTILKVVGVGLTVGGTIVSSIVSDKNQAKLIEKAVDEKLSSNK